MKAFCAVVCYLMAVAFMYAIGALVHFTGENDAWWGVPTGMLCTAGVLGFLIGGTCFVIDAQEVTSRVD